MNDKLRQWIEAEIDRLQQTVNRFRNYSNPAIRDMVTTASAQEAALQSVLQKDAEIEATQPNLNTISTVDVPPEVNDMVSEQFWDLIGKDNDE